MNYHDKPWLKSYDSGVEPEVAIPQKSYVDLMEEGFKNNPDNPAMHFMGVTITYRELDEASAKFADFLTKNNYGPGDVVGIHLPNTPQYLITLAGTQRAGLASTGVSMLLTPKELAHQINDSGAKVLVTMDSFFEQTLLKVQDKVPGLENILVTNVADFLPFLKRFLGKLLKKVPTGKMVPIKGKTVGSFMDMLKTQSPQKPDVKLTPDDACLIQYTGGTTGLPKGVVLTHGNIVANITQVRDWTHFEIGKDILCSGFPFFHQAGQMFGLMAMCTGNPQCLIPDPRNTAHIANEIKTYGVTLMANVPTLYQMLLDDPAFKALDFSNVRACISGAAPFSVEAIKKYEDLVGKDKVVEVYGMTETSPLITSNPYEGKKKIGSVGIPLPATRVKIMDVETGTKEMPFGEEGEIITNGPQIMARYHNKPEETSHAIREIDGEKWLYTGDVARMDEDGFLFIVDRAKDMLIVGGYKVFSREVEESLYQIPAIEFCAIVGVTNPDRPGSETVKAVIQLASDHLNRDKEEVKQEILVYCKENMAPYKVPKIIKFIDEIPLTAVGKVDKKVLR